MIIDVLVCSIPSRVPAALECFRHLRAQKHPARRIVLRADSWLAADRAAAASMGVEVQEVPAGIGQQARWFDVERWPDDEALVLCLDDDIMLPSTALGGYVSLHRRKGGAIGPWGIWFGPRGVLDLSWAGALAVRPAHLRGLGQDDTAKRHLRFGMSDEVLIAFWLRTRRVMQFLHPESQVSARCPWPQHPLARAPTACRNQLAFARNRLEQAREYLARDKTPTAGALWRRVINDNEKRVETLTRAQNDAANAAQAATTRQA